MPEKFKREQKEYWDKQHKDREQEFSALEQEPNEFAKKNCLRYIKPGGKILEVGVANGRNARYFVRENKNTVVGVDISTEALDNSLLPRSKIKQDNILPIVTEATEVPELLGDQEYLMLFMLVLRYIWKTINSFPFCNMLFHI